MSYSSLVDYCERYNDEIPSRFQYFYKYSKYSILFDKKYSVMMRLWMFTGEMIGWLKKYSRDRDESLVKTKKSLEDVFTPQLKKMLDDKLKDENIEV